LVEKGASEPSEHADTVDSERGTYQRSPGKSICSASRELQIPRTAMQKILHLRLRVRASKIQTVQTLKPKDRPRLEDFTLDMLRRTDNDNVLLVMSQSSFTCTLW
jgi:hypothetical protein